MSDARALSVAVDPTCLAAAIKTVEAFISQDVNRPGIRAVHAEVTHLPRELALTATDGHTLCSVKVSCEAAVGEVRLSLETLEALAVRAAEAKRAKMNTVTLAFLHDAAGPVFPLYQRLVPVRESGTGPRVHGFNARYLARLEHVQKHLKSDHARIQLPEDTDGSRRRAPRGRDGEARRSGGDRHAREAAPVSGLSFRQRAEHAIKIKAWARAIRDASAEHGRPNSFAVRELAGLYAGCEVRFGYYLGLMRCLDLWQALGGHEGWGSCPTYAKGRFCV